MQKSSNTTIYNQAKLDEYLKDDYILDLLEQYPEDKQFISHEWLLNMPVKRMIYADVYGALLKEEGKKILDVGGGFCGLSRELIEKHDYTLLDIMAHDDHTVLQELSSSHNNFWVQSDWYEFEEEVKYDYIIANDIFPNVDQRLRLFLEKFKGSAKELLCTLTCNDRDIFYKVKRIDAEEVLTMAPWTRHMTEEVLKETFADESIELPQSTDPEPLFGNGRVVYKFHYPSS